MVQVLMFDQDTTLSLHPENEYYNPSSYVNDSLPFTIRPKEQILIAICDSSRWASRKIKFLNDELWVVKPSMQKLCFLIRNSSSHVRLHVKTGCTLTSILSHPAVKHKLCHSLENDIVQAQMHWGRGFLTMGVNKNLISYLSGQKKR